MGDDESLLCITNNTQCCRRMDTPNDVRSVGEWYFPNNGSPVGISNDGGDFYRDRGLSVVRLNRRNKATSPTGQFCCELPDDNERYLIICINVQANSAGE